MKHHPPRRPSNLEARCTALVHAAIGRAVTDYVHAHDAAPALPADWTEVLDEAHAALRTDQPFPAKHAVFAVAFAGIKTRLLAQLKLRKSEFVREDPAAAVTYSTDVATNVAMAETRLETHVADAP